MANIEPDILATSDMINVSTSKLKKKYYNPDVDKIDIDKVKSDINKIQLDIDAIKSSGLYSFNKNSNKYIKVFDELKDDYLKILNVKKKALESFLHLVSFDNINIPDSFKKKLKEEWRVD